MSGCSRASSSFIHQRQVALRLALQAPTRLDPIQVAVDVELEQRRRVIGRSSSGRGIDAGEAPFAQIEFIDEDIDDPNRIGLGDEVIQPLGQQRLLCAALTFDEALHDHSSH